MPPEFRLYRCASCNNVHAGYTDSCAVCGNESLVEIVPRT